MLKFRTNLTLILLTSSLAISGCATPVAPSAGIGYQKMKPKAKTAKYIVENDRQFANQVASNNRTCDAHPGCIK